ncbi:DUF881 domain-containing protein [Jonesia quinghaiensis]|uniref:DUF881 domain-containing protein n=1 Tax=Jonesia quinghaiensis TaxID=262806 RepID=UPI0003FFDFB4|nr:DUF881 domain-containing protein [Jonesia quinghaiensis]
MTHQDPHSPQREVPPDASMSLLNEIMRNPLDLGYSAAARRRAREDVAGVPKRSHVVEKILILLLAIAIGVGGVTAVRELRERAAVTSSARTLLIDQIDDRQTTLRELESEVGAKQSTVDTLRAQLLEEQDPELMELLHEDQLHSGVTAVQGSGVTVTLRDGTGSELDPNKRVHDVDVRVVVNGLWAAGAEAIAINGQRLTPTSAIRSAGPAILVDLTGLTSPYRIDAVGDAEDMTRKFSESPAAQQLTGLSDSYGISWSIDESSSLALPGGTARGLVHASVRGNE